jgi:hypothetical protein
MDFGLVEAAGCVCPRLPGREISQARGGRAGRGGGAGTGRRAGGQTQEGPGRATGPEQRGPPGRRPSAEATVARAMASAASPLAAKRRPAHAASAAAARNLCPAGAGHSRLPSSVDPPLTVLTTSSPPQEHHQQWPLGAYMLLAGESVVGVLCTDVCSSLLSYQMPRSPSFPSTPSCCLIIFLCDPRTTYSSVVSSHSGYREFLLIFISILLRCWPRHDLYHS